LNELKLLIIQKRLPLLNFAGTNETGELPETNETAQFPETNEIVEFSETNETAEVFEDVEITATGEVIGSLESPTWL
jgi:hypothetical protein